MNTDDKKGSVCKRARASALFLPEPGAWEIPRTGRPGTLPVVGVTGDLYTRMNPVGNAGLFRRLEQMGCEVWPSPFFATLTDLLAALNFHSEAGRAQIKDAALEGFTWALVSGVRYRLVRRLQDDVVRAAVEPPVEELIQLAQPYVGPQTNYLNYRSGPRPSTFSVGEPRV